MPRVPEWDAHPRETASLLGLLFAWAAAKKKNPTDVDGVGEGCSAGVDSRVFTIVCPTSRVRMNIETYVKDRETGRVAVQWCLASKESGENMRHGAVCVRKVVGTCSMAVCRINSS